MQRLPFDACPASALLLLLACCAGPGPVPSLQSGPRLTREPSCFNDGELPALAPLQPRFQELLRKSEEVSAEAFDGGTEQEFVERYARAASAQRRFNAEAIALVREHRRDYEELLSAKLSAQKTLRALTDAFPDGGVAWAETQPLRQKLEQEVSDVRFLLELLDREPDDLQAARTFYGGFRARWRDVDVLGALTGCQEGADYGSRPEDCPYLPRLGRFGLGAAADAGAPAAPWRSPCVRALFESEGERSALSEWDALVKDLELDEALRLAQRVQAVRNEGGEIAKLNFWDHPSIAFDPRAKTVTEFSYCRNDFFPRLGANKDGMPNWYRDCTPMVIDDLERAAFARGLLRGP